MSNPPTPHPVVKQKACLIVIDGWGVSDSPDVSSDAIRSTKKPVMDSFEQKYPKNISRISAHGLNVGLPDGLMGNSEVGHLNIGAGRIVYQDIVRIDLAIKENNFKDQPAFAAALNRAKNGNGRIHLLGLISDGGVHSHIEHLFHMIKCCKDAGIKECYVHFFGDGRDTAPASSAMYLEQVLAKLDELKYGSVADIVGRYYAMDRDKRWERVQIAYDMLVNGTGEVTTNPVQTVKDRYEKNETDEFLKPIISNVEGRIRDNDTVVMFNYRSDRMRQLTSVLGDLITPSPVKKTKELKNIDITTMTRYASDIPYPTIFPPQTMDNVLAEWLSKCGVPQMHTAETEKYAHVTFFFNGGREGQFDLEERCLVPSPKVATYDLKPEMSAREIAANVAEQVLSGKYPFVMCNIASPDMVGHTGNFPAAQKAIEATDAAIGTIYEACQKAGYVLMITADHGNAEKMFDENGGIHTAHTTYPVPFVVCSTERELYPISERMGALCDVAPTVLDLMGLPVPVEMTGKSLLKK